MGIVPLQIPQEWTPKQLRIAAGDTIEIGMEVEKLAPRCAIQVRLRRAGTGETVAIAATALVDTMRDVRLVQEGGIIPMILRQALAASRRVSSAA